MVTTSITDGKKTLSELFPASLDRIITIRTETITSEKK